ncbi:DUF4247 domain-containing protein [Neobacillus sp. SM06]|uniref:DUF4247 domain-containing protein n=1 Tax=Neobacillus sp. SM06 TaxID=3422492 RepID=UPI003D2A525C
MWKFLKVFLAISLVVSLFSVIGKWTATASTYPLESIVENGSQVSKVYRVENKTVPEVAEEISANKKPQEISKQDSEKMFLVYPNEWYFLQKDPQKPKDTLIEVDNKDFIRENYNPAFFNGFITGYILNDIFRSGKKYAGSFQGYSKKNIYKPKIDYRPPTTQQKKSFPPLTIKGTGSIIKRGEQFFSKTFKNDSNGTGKNLKPSRSTIQKNAPPKVNRGGFGTIKRRK